MTAPTLWETESNFIRLLAEMEETGIKIDTELCQQKLEYGTYIQEQIKNILGWNPASAKDLGNFLLNEMGYPILKRTSKGNPSFDKQAMAEYDELLQNDGSDVAKQVARFRGWQKTCSSNYAAYLKLKDENDIVHPNYKYHGTRTGRLSCEEPNLQQLPKESENEWNGDLKKAFIPRSLINTLVEWDYGQLETRFAAAVAGEEELLDAFRFGIDVFQVMADRLKWPRQDCKLFNYMTLYGAGKDKVKIVFGLSLSDAKAMIEDFFSAYPKLRKAAKKAENIAKKQGYITYWTGRRRHLSYGEAHKAFNSYTQGGCAEIVKRRMLDLSKQIEFPLVLTVHDSVMMEIPNEKLNIIPKVTQILQAVPEAKSWGVPFTVEHKTWGLPVS